MSRPVLVHYHIFKNAGTSVDWMLERSFSDAWSTVEGRTATDILSSEHVRRFLEANAHLSAISSHLARPPLPWPGAKAIVYLRHPIERVRSVFAFVAADASQPNHHIAKERGFRGYVRWALGSADGGVVIRNYQVVHLSEASFRAPHVHMANATRNDLETAVAYLNEWRTVGVVSRFDESCRAFEAAYRPLFPALRMTPIRLNVTRERGIDLATSCAQIRDALGADVYDRLVDANELDLELFQQANHLLEQQIAQSRG
jgi:hypothetical protein